MKITVEFGGYYEIENGKVLSVHVAPGYQPVTPVQVQAYVNRGFAPTHCLSACLAQVNDCGHPSTGEDEMMLHGA